MKRELLKFNSRRNPVRFGAACYKSDAPEETELLEKIKKQVSDQLETRAPKDQFEALKTSLDGLSLDGLRSLLKEEGGVMSILAKQGEKINELEVQNSQKAKDLSIRAQVAAWHEKNKEVIERIKNGQKPTESLNMELRVPVTMTVGGSLNSSPYLPNVGIDPNVIDLVREQPTFWERLQKGRTRLNPYVWINKKNKEGAAEFIGEGVLKPLASFELDTESSVPKKVAERMKSSTELLFDVDSMTTLIENELRYEVMMAANSAVLTGVESNTNPKGVTQYGVPYSLLTIKTTNPTEADAIRAAITQLRLFYYTRNIVAWINPVDGANMDLAKGVTGGAYMLPPFVSADGRTIGGVQVIEDTNIPQGYLLIGDMSKYKILMYQDFHINWGWENDDFSKNLVTVIGEMRFHQFVSENHANAFIYDTFANIKAALTI